ncbi:MAG: tRNA preQ1(34) S-adenosylmethionine ribosyltransferase-isomerase QueA [Anaeromyxobacter sp.]|nr:tRNA preQ1(34) S-adenosylmethionine ribosyltransferase-isomerase QueA [Anaeromyxobacter sp.]MBL0276787.1 tRNA preQ1(34) S-adenosylmethionine ribosyltransferase-isomerase QueA [Anaeromyxobacter sp.]
MEVSDFDYPLPEELIAQAPVSPRDASRLLCLAGTGPTDHRAFADLPDLLQPGDLVVFNDTRVIPARLVGVKEGTGGKVEMLLVDPVGGDLPRRWRAMGQAAKPIREGARLRFGELLAVVERVEGEGFYALLLDREGPALEAALAVAGRLPLPPYIRRAPTADDAERYQTVFARRPGSAAAPTAGLHFTPEVLARLEARGVARAAVTLHVGPGTFLPVRGESLEQHRMHEERFEVGAATVEAVAACRGRGGRVVAVGTTAVRTLESAFCDGRLQAGAGRTALFIRPGHTFGVVDALVTNFHLPRSTLLMLVCAFGGRERVLAAYAEAVSCRYRFFSYGDAMLLTRGASTPGPMV